MARLDEIADGLTAILRVSQEPEPLGVDLQNHSPAEALFLVRAVVDACARNIVPLTSIRVCPDLGSRLILDYGETKSGYQGIGIISDKSLSGRIEFYRFAHREGLS